MELKEQKKVKTNLCAAAKRFQTKGEALEHLKNKNNTLYLMEKVVNGRLDISCFGRCCNSVHDGQLCHIHKNQQKREKSFFLNYEKDIKNKCDNNIIKIADINHPYFKNAGVKGKKKKKTILQYFKNENDPIYIILEKYPDLLNSLRLHATKLLQSTNDSKKDKNEIEFIEKDEKSNNKLLDSINKFAENLDKNSNTSNHIISSKSMEEMFKLVNDETNDEKEKNLSHNTSENEFIDLEDLNDIDNSDDNSDTNSMNTQEILDFDIESLDINSNNSNEKRDKEQNDEDNEDDLQNDVQDDEQDEEDEQDDDSYVVDTIYTNKGKLLYLEPSSMNIIEPEGDNDGTCIGILHKVEKKYSTIEKSNEYFTVLSQNKLIHNSKEYYRDVLNDRIFERINDKFVFKGRVTKKNNSSSYLFHLD